MQALHTFWRTTCNYGVAPFVLPVPMFGMDVDEINFLAQWIGDFKPSKVDTHWTVRPKVRLFSQVFFVKDDAGELITDDNGDYVFADGSLTTAADKIIPYITLEDQETVEEIAKGVCLPLDGSAPMEADLSMPVLTYITYDVSNTEESGFKWIAPNGDWTTSAIHSTGYVMEFDGDILFEVYENAGRLSNRNTGLFWENERVLVSDPNVSGADAITNIMSLTQAEYNAITPDADTLYVING